MDPYKILGVEQGASTDEIKRAYRAKAKKYHPDHGGDAWVFQQIRDAYEQLVGNPSNTNAHTNTSYSNTQGESNSENWGRQRNSENEQSNQNRDFDYGGAGGFGGHGPNSSNNTYQSPPNAYYSYNQQTQPNPEQKKQQQILVYSLGTLGLALLFLALGILFWQFDWFANTNQHAADSNANGHNERVTLDQKNNNQNGVVNSGQDEARNTPKNQGHSSNENSNPGSITDQQKLESRDEDSARTSETPSKNDDQKNVGQNRGDELDQENKSTKANDHPLANGVKTVGEVAVQSSPGYTSNCRTNPVIAGSTSGAFVVVFEENQPNNSNRSNLKALLYSGEDNSEPKTITIRDSAQNKTRWGQLLQPTVAMAKDGSFVVAWSETEDSQYLQDIYAQRFDSEGNKIDGRMQINSFRNNQQLWPAIDLDSEGNFAIAWMSVNQLSRQHGFGIFAQAFYSNGSRNGKEFEIDDSIDPIHQSWPSIRFHPNGSPVVSVIHTGGKSQPNNLSIYAFRQAFEKVAMPVIENPEATSIFGSSCVDINDAGDLGVVVWPMKDNSERSKVFGQLFNADGMLIGNRFALSDNDQMQEKLAMVRFVSNDTFLAVWLTEDQSQQAQLVYRYFNSDGHPISISRKVHAENAILPAGLIRGGFDVAVAGERHLVAWMQTGSNGGIFIRDLRQSTVE